MAIFEDLEFWETSPWVFCDWEGVMVGEYGDLTGLMELRQQLMIDCALDGFFNERYGKSANHFVGLKSQFAMTDYPFLCYVPNDAARGGLGGDFEVISVLVGVYDQQIDGGVARGALSLGLAGGYILDAINTDWTGINTSFLGRTREANDMQVAHPTYRKEIQIPLKVTRTP